MNIKEVREIRRRFNSDHANISNIIGCYVGTNGDIISRFKISTALMQTDEREKYYQLLKKTLAGKIGKNLQNLSFRTTQVAESEEYKILYQLRESHLEDETALNIVLEKMISSLKFDTSYVIMFAYDRYDVPFKNKNGEIFEDESDSIFSYIVCAVCPVKLTKTELTYSNEDSLFHNKGTDSVIESPALGFLYPAFDDRTTNLYGALYYAKGSSEVYPDFIHNVFQLPEPIPADEKREQFGKLMTESLGDACNLKTMYAIEDLMNTQKELAKEDKDCVCPTVNEETVCETLQELGIDSDTIEKFSSGFSNQFGNYTEIPVDALQKQGKCEIKLQDIVIKVSGESKNLVEIKKIGDNNYLMIRIDEGVEYNGIELNLGN